MTGYRCQRNNRACLDSGRVRQQMVFLNRPPVKTVMSHKNINLKKDIEYSYSGFPRNSSPLSRKRLFVKTLIFVILCPNLHYFMILLLVYRRSY